MNTENSLTSQIVWHTGILHSIRRFTAVFTGWPNCDLLIILTVGWLWSFQLSRGEDSPRATSSDGGGSVTEQPCFRALLCSGYNTSLTSVSYYTYIHYFTVSALCNVYYSGLILHFIVQGILNTSFSSIARWRELPRQIPMTCSKILISFFYKRPWLFVIIKDIIITAL